MRPIHQVVPRLLIHAGSARRLSSGRVLHCRPDRDRRDVGRWSEAHVDDHAEHFDEGLRDDHDGGDGQRVGARFARRSVPAGDKGKGKEISLLATFNV